MTACELHSHRAALIESYKARMHVENIEVVTGDSAKFRPEWENAFDGVLCDVPCSGFGTVAENPDLPLNKKESDLGGLVQTQKEILLNCARYVKPGGAITYSTCSIFGEENDGVVASFLECRENFEAEHISSPLVYEKTQYGVQFLPDTAFGAGYYAAKLRRKR